MQDVGSAIMKPVQDVISYLNNEILADGQLLLARLHLPARWRPVNLTRGPLVGLWLCSAGGSSSSNSDSDLGD